MRNSEQDSYEPRGARVRQAIEGIVRKTPILKLAGGTALAVALLAGSCTSVHHTGTNEVGVRTRKVAIFNPVGIDTAVYQPGQTYFFAPFINDWNTFDTKLQNIQMSLNPEKGDKKGDDAIQFKTRDGNDIKIDVTFSYRIDPKKAPYILQNVAQSDAEIKDKVVRTVARSRTRDILGELSTEEIYDANHRNDAAKRATTALQQILGPLGVIVENVATSDYQFINVDYATAIKNKKLAEGQRQTLLSTLDARKEENKRLLSAADSAVNAMIAVANGSFRKDSVDADSYFLQQQSLAQAIESEGRNAAVGIMKQREAMTSSGGRTRVQMEVADALAGKPIYMLPQMQGGMNMTTFNVNDFMKGYMTRGTQAQDSTVGPRKKP